MLPRLSTRTCLLLAASLAACGTTSRNEPPDTASGGNLSGGDGSTIRAGQSGAMSGGTAGRSGNSGGATLGLGGSQQSGGVATNESGGAGNAAQTGFGEAGFADGGAGTCADAVVSAGEACDDGNLVSGDGCSAHCRLERGYVCSGEPSRCHTMCGDGIVAGSESCDDGNQNNADACINDCQRPILSVGGAVSCVLQSGAAKCWGASSAASSVMAASTQGRSPCQSQCRVSTMGYRLPAAAGRTARCSAMGACRAGAMVATGSSVMGSTM